MATPARPLHRGAACLSCRRKRSKCDGERPVCGRCVRNDNSHDCVYEQVQKSALTVLKERVDALEGENRMLKKRLENDTIVEFDLDRIPTTPTTRRTYNHNHNSSMDSHPDSLVNAITNASLGRNLIGSPSQIRTPTASPPQHHRQPSPPGAEIVSYDNVPFVGLIQQPPDSFSIFSESTHLTNYDAHQVGHAMYEINDTWWDNDEPTNDFKQHLLNIFIAHRRQCACEVPVQRFIDSLNGPPKDRPHPGLLNAIYMLACWFSYPLNLTRFESVFLARSRELLAEALTTGEKMLNYLQGSALLAIYYYGSGRMLEGYEKICSAAQMAVVCGLHQISSAVWRDPEAPNAAYMRTASQWTGNFRRTPFLLLPPKDALELGERIHAFWSVWILDTSGCATHGLPSMFDQTAGNTRVTTPLPVPLDDYANGMVFDHTSSTLQDFWDNEGLTHLRDSPVTLRIKATAVFERACNLSTIWGGEALSDLSAKPSVRQDPMRDPTFEPTFHLIDRTTTNLWHSFPPLSGSTSLGGEIIADWYTAGIDPVLVHSSTLTLCAMIQLHNIKASNNMESYERCLIAARDTISICQSIQGLDFFQLDIMLGISWMSTSHILLRELERQRRRMHTVKVKEVEDQLHLLHFVLRKLGQVYPLVDIQAQKAEMAFRECY